MQTIKKIVARYYIDQENCTKKLYRLRKLYWKIVVSEALII